MNATDLMLGDWVLDGDVYAQVTSITCNGNIETTHNEHSNIELIEPISLTPEILEKTGFTLNMEETDSTIQNVYYHHTEFFNFPLGRGFYIEHDTVDNVFWITDHIFIIFKYVHEFQHILKLCKINKDIVL